ncbi:MAG TPA: HAMP domain-containing histidine kinase [Candidatus Merdenecus merdavium]|nr:HAMP domain-containing histidine kinase [Candidatus Merdenecus merdavium]
MRIFKRKRKKHKHSLSTLIVLVLFVFIIILFSVAVSGLLLHFLTSIGILPHISQRRFPTLFLFLLLVSVFIGTILATIGGDYLLRPLHRLIEATKEVASGNFDVEIDIENSKELNRLALSFNEMTKELSNIEALRNDFVGNISHEFKTPVVSIRGFANRLKSNTLSEEQRNEYLDIIISETERLSRLSSNILYLSNLETLDMEPKNISFSLDEQIRKSILLLEPYFEKKQLELDINMESISIRSNEEMISHLWGNLLENAIKFSPKGATITITLQSKGKYAEVSISDEGIGMDAEVKKHIFDKFYQGDNSRVTEGSGLGLSLVKKILQLNGGKISVESEPNKGSRFIVLLPYGF